MTGLRTKFGARIRLLRNRAGLTQEQLAIKAGISVDFLSLVERGLNSPSFENIEKLAYSLTTEVHNLFVFEDILDDEN